MLFCNDSRAAEAAATSHRTTANFHFMTRKSWDDELKGWPAEQAAPPLCVPGNEVQRMAGPMSEMILEAAQSSRKTESSHLYSELEFHCRLF